MDNFDLAAADAGYFDPAQMIEDGVESANTANQIVELRRQDQLI